MKRLEAFLMWLLGYILPVGVYLRLNGYDPNKVGERFDNLAKKYFKE